jgi:hypothetical protein
VREIHPLGGYGAAGHGMVPRPRYGSPKLGDCFVPDADGVEVEAVYHGPQEVGPVAL